MILFVWWQRLVHRFLWSELMVLTGHWYSVCALDVPMVPVMYAWGRRSVFRVAGKPLLVGEYFLPELLRKASRF